MRKIGTILDIAYEWIRSRPGGMDDVLFALPFVIFVTVVYWLIRRAMHRRSLGERFKEARKQGRTNEIIRLLLVCWISTIVCMTLFPTEFFNAVWSLMAYGGWGLPLSLGDWSWNYTPILLPYLTVEGYAATHTRLKDLLELLENIVLFVPLGWALPLIWRRASFWKCIAVGLISSLFIELVQPFIKRNGSIDDVVCNTLGVAIGYFLCLLTKKLFPKFTEKCRITVR